jgi:tetratricopeptide (TPR) repeat protein
VSRAQTLAKARAEGRRKLKTNASPESGAFLTGKNLKIVLCILLGAATIALYSPVIGHSFVVLDDQEYVTGNRHIQGGAAWSTIEWAFTSTYAANWHPLTWLSHALDYQLFGLNPAGHHFDSVLIHALNVVLLFLLLAWMTKRVGPSLLVAALFAVHPLNVESVAWVAERKNVLSTLFFILAIAAYTWYAQKPDWRRYLLVAALFAAGLMAKPMVITLPFVLLLLDYWPLGRTAGSHSSPVGAPQVTGSKLVLEKVPLLVLSAASAWITLIAQRTGHAVRTLEAFPLGVRIENAVVAYGLYLWKMFWPARLALYPHSATLPAWQWILSALVLISVTALVVIFRGKGYLPVGWFWFLGTLVPVLGLVQVGEYAMADRYAYIPLIGIFVMIAWGLADWAEAREVRTAWLVIPAVCVLTALGCVTLRQMSYWESEYDLWSHTLEVAENPLTHNAIGVALMHPDSHMTGHDLENFGTAQNRMHEARWHYEEALKSYRQLVQQNPDAYLPGLAGTLNNFGLLDGTQNQMDNARQHFEGALRIYRQLAQQNPDAYLPYLALTLDDLGSVDQRQNRIDEARQHYEEALRSYRQLTQQNPEAYLLDMATAHNNLGTVDGIQNRLDDARRHFEEALKIYRQAEQRNPDAHMSDLAMTLTNFGKLDQLQNRIEESRAHYTEAVTIYRNLAHGDPARYAGEVAKVETRLQELR